MSSLKFCAYPNCPNLVKRGYCEQHQPEPKPYVKGSDGHKKSPEERGYTYRWKKYAKWFLSQPQNQICKLHLDSDCAVIAQCVDHIIPPESADDPLFWDESNHQPACIHCNSVKGHRTIVGEFEM